MTFKLTLCGEYEEFLFSDSLGFLSSVPSLTFSDFLPAVPDVTSFSPLMRVWYMIPMYEQAMIRSGNIQQYKKSMSPYERSLHEEEYMLKAHPMRYDFNLKGKHFLLL